MTSNSSEKFSLHGPKKKLLYSVAYLLGLVALAISLPKTMTGTCQVSKEIFFKVSTKSGGSIVFFNSESGPYMGGILSFTSNEKVVSYHDGVGLYWRRIEKEDRSSIWTLSFSIWYPIIFLWIFPQGIILCYRVAIKRRSEATKLPH